MPSKYDFFFSLLPSEEDKATENNGEQARKELIEQKTLNHKESN